MSGQMPVITQAFVTCISKWVVVQSSVILNKYAFLVECVEASVFPKRKKLGEGSKYRYIH